MPLTQSSRPGLRARALLRWPASLLAGAGLKWLFQNGQATVSLDYPSLADVASIADPSDFTVALYQKSAGAYGELALTNLPQIGNPFPRASFGDADYVVPTTDRYVALTAALTAPRNVSLPAASAYPGGMILTVQDEAGGVSAVNTLTLVPNGADTINGAASVVLKAPRAAILLRSNGANRWSVMNAVPLPAGGDVGKALRATAAGVFGWDTGADVPTAAAGDVNKVLTATGTSVGAWAWATPAIDDKSRRNILLSAIRIAKQAGAAQRSLDQIADGYAGSDAINAGASSGYTLDAANKWVTTNWPKISFTGTANIGGMTGGGGVAAAFDGNATQTGAASASSPAATAGYVNANAVGKDWGSGVTRTVTRFKVVASSDSSFNGGGVAGNLKLQGSNDSTTWIDLYTAAFTGAASEAIDVSSGIVTTTAYRYHRAVINGNGANNTRVAELEFYQTSDISEIVLVSAAQAADAAPASARVLLMLEPIDAVTLNTDLIAEVSRDGGSNWTAGTLTQIGTIGALRVVETGATSLTGQPSGSSVVARVKSFNDKQMRLHGLALAWS